MRVTSVRAALFGSVAAAALYTTPAAAAAAQADTQPTAASNAQTQDTAASGSNQDIVVTARRRNELLLNVPIAVTAYSGEQLDRQGALNITDVAATNNRSRIVSNHQLVVHAAIDPAEIENEVEN